MLPSEPVGFVKLPGRTRHRPKLTSLPELRNPFKRSGLEVCIAEVSRAEFKPFWNRKRRTRGIERSGHQAMSCERLEDHWQPRCLQRLSSFQHCCIEASATNSPAPRMPSARGSQAEALREALATEAGRPGPTPTVRRTRQHVDSFHISVAEPRRSKSRRRLRGHRAGRSHHAHLVGACGARSVRKDTAA